MIELEEVCVELDGVPVLGPLSLSLEPGTLLGLIGPPGAGKTVLIKLIAGLLAPARGRVRVLGGDPRASAAAAARGELGMVFQNNALFDSRTIYENVAFPLRRSGRRLDSEELDRRVRARLAEVGLSRSAELHPHELSGGMQKRAGIARATVSDPVIRLYDEPTAGLDPVTSMRILELVVALHRRVPGVSVVISNEVDSLLRVVPRVLMLHRGRVVFEGPRAALEGPAAPELARSFVRGDVDAPL